MTDGIQFLDNAQRWKQRREAGESQAAIARDEGCAASYISGSVKVLDLPDRYHKMLRADKMQIEAAMKFAKIRQRYRTLV